MESVYDEFGNYIGPELDHDDDDERDDEGQSEGERDTEEWEERDDAPSHSAGDADGRRSPPSSSPHVDGTASPSDPTARAVQLGSVLAASSSSSSSSSLVPSYYPSAAELYGSETEVVVGDEDAQAIETPLIAPLQTHAFAHVEAELPRCTWDWRYLAGLMDHPDLIRHVAVIGHLHHGKTALLDLLVENTHAAPASGKRPTRYTDSGVAEQQRGVSIKCAPMSFVLPSLSSKSFLVNIMDTPGHVDFSDEVTAALRIADTALLVVDAAEGMQLQSRRLLQHAVREGLRVLLLINKVDRLIVELKLPPTDAYHKLHLIVEDVNGLLQAAGSAQRVSPAANSVVFASSAHSFLFSLRSFAQLYAHAHPEAALDHRAFARRLWGNSFLGADGRFSSTPQSGSSTRSFVAFILEPLYKLYAHVLGSEGPQLKALLQELGVQVTKAELNLDSKALLRIVLSRVFGGVEALTEALVEHGPSPVHAADAKVRHVYTGLVNSPAAQAMLSCSRTGVAMLHVTKLFCRHDAAVFDAFGRVFSGHLKVGDTVRVLGEGYSLDDEEDSSMRTITRIWVYNARYRVEVSGVGAGNWALFEGIDAPISKTATVTSSTASDVSIFRPLAFDTIGPMKVAIEPLNPSELPKMLEGLRRVTKTYPLSSTKVEESGEHVLMGPGELYLDCALHDLRKAYSDIEVRVSDPVVRFCETVVDTSQLECRALSGNGANRLSMVAEPLEPAIADDIEHGRLRVGAGKEEDERTRARLEREYGWDVLQSRSIWAFGPDDQGPNILVDETLPAETNKKLLFSAKDSVVQGFRWGVRGGPLCDETIRGVKFRLLSASLSPDPLLRPRGQLISTARRVLYSSFLLAQPRLLEPVYASHILAPSDCVTSIASLLQRRRGHIQSSAPVPGSPLYSITASLPLIEAFGYEVDVRVHTQGQAAVQSLFSGWQLVPGDPLDEEAGKGIGVLERVEGERLAREFLVKTRRRKGLTEDVQVSKFLDDDMLLDLSKLNEQRMR